MNLPRQLREEIIRECDFLGNEPDLELPYKRPHQNTGSQSPTPRTSSKNQIEQLKAKVGSESRKQTAEEFKKKAIESNRKMNKDTEETKSLQSTPDFKRHPKKAERPKAIRTEFPENLISDFPFLDSPLETDDISHIVKLTDGRCGRKEVEDIISQISKNKT